jgi:tetratricopeptide (TPR) repeat protein
MNQLLLIGLIGFVTTLNVSGQTSVFTVFTNATEEANRSFLEQDYPKAIENYKAILKKNPSNKEARLNLARSFYQLKRYREAIGAYDEYMRTSNTSLPANDIYSYAEAQSTEKNYAAALVFYKRLFEADPDNHVVAQKIWRINNIQYLFEDSTHFAVRSLPMNTRAGELCPLSTEDGLIFLSNRVRNTMQDHTNKKANMPYYERYRMMWKTDTITGMKIPKGKVSVYSTGSRSQFNSGPIALYNGQTQMVYVATSDNASDVGDRTLGLYFSIKENNKWKRVSAFAFNSMDYSIYDVTINEDGNKLFFTSNMKGGIGGKDIYRSELKDGQWTKPENAGDIINTPYNESFPSWHEGGVLFFSSDGHPGLGGLDIFRVPITPSGFGEPQNLGHPMNSSHDDFGISFDLPTHGYFSSNRKNGAFDDDIYEFDMDLQTYPFTITGIIKFKEHNWSDQSEIRSWPNVSFALIDSQNGNTVFQGTSGPEGQFSLTIPYFSRYYIQIFDEGGKAHKASLELQKYRTETHVHEIVVVKDIY